MNRCPITYQPCGEALYSPEGLKLLSRKLHNLKKIPYSSAEQLQLANSFGSKMSIQGVQPKLSAKLNNSEEQFEIVEKGGTFILKPPHVLYKELPQNEDLTMHLAALVGIEVPLHGLVYNIEEHFTYFIKRFDRQGKRARLHVEDFAQLAGDTRDTKYDSSMEKLIPIIEKNCTFPLLEKLKLFRRTLFSFLAGNEDMHLKNFSLIHREGKIELSPAYDLLNTTLVINGGEELALPLNGKKSNIKAKDLIDYYGHQRLGLQHASVDQELEHFQKAFSGWEMLISQSFLSKEHQERYLEILHERRARLGL